MKTSETHTQPDSAERPADAADPVNETDIADEIFEPARQTRVSAESLERVLQSLLKRYPDAHVMTMRPDGILIDPPKSIELGDHQIVKARSGLDMVTGPDRMRLLEAWDRMLAGGAARCVARLADQPDMSVAIHQLDMRETHGAIVVVVAPPEATADGEAPKIQEVQHSTPRFATVRKDERSFLIGIDEALTEILGWTAEEMEGHRSIEFIHPDDHALAIDNWMEMLASPGPGRRVRLRHRARDGRWVWFEVTNHNLLDDPEHGCVICEIVDITEEMAAQEELRAREQLLDRIAEAIPMGLLQVDAERNVVYTNDRLHEILGVERRENADAQLAGVVEEDRAALEQALTEVLGDGCHADIEIQLLVPPHDERRLCSINLRALSFEDGTTSGAIACVADVTDSARMRDELKRRATFDELTGCYNRASIMLALEGDIVGRDQDADRAVMFVDLDHFKSINDHYGHGAGDEMLRMLAARLTGAIRGEDVVGRIGGDEFLVLCPSIGGTEQAMRLAARLSETMSQEVELSCGTLTHKVSVGVAWSRGADTDAEDLVARADAAMYESKRERAGRPQLADTVEQAAVAGRASARRAGAAR